MLAVTALLARRARLLHASARAVHAHLPTAASSSLVECVAVLQVSNSRAFSSLDGPLDQHKVDDDVNVPTEDAVADAHKMQEDVDDLKEAVTADAPVEEDNEFEDLLAPPPIEMINMDLGDGHVYVDASDDLSDFDAAVEEELGALDDSPHYDHVDDHQQKNKKPDQKKLRRHTSPGPRMNRPLVALRELRSQEKRAQRHLSKVEADEVDYEHELEGVWSKKEAKERLFQQAIRRETDKYRVCRNCGERGHLARNCLVPVICSNCGNLGHLAENCRFPTFDSIDEFLEHEEYLEKQEQRWGKLRARRMQKKPTGTPEAKKVIAMNESNRMKLESEMDEYLERMEVRRVKREARAAEKKAKAAEKAQETEEPVDPKDV